MREKLAAILKSVAKKDDIPGADESLFDSGFLDSFALTDLVGAIEVEFNIKVPDKDLNPRKFESIEKIESYIESRQ